MKGFIYLTDIHYGAKPSNRKDDYNASILTKLDYVLGIAAKNDCVVLIGGDLFDNPRRISFIEFNRLIQVFRKYPVDVYCIDGNESHDGIGDSSPLEVLKYAGIIKRDKGFEDFDSVRVIFRGHGSDSGSIDADLSPSKLNLLMTHETIVEDHVPFDHKLIDEFETKADLVTIGHYHPYQGIKTRQDGVIFVAPGALARRKKIKHELNRSPKFVFISTKNGKFKLKEFDIPCEKDIWNDKAVIEIDDNLFANISNNVDSMSEELNLVQTAVSLEDAIKTFGTTNEFPEEIINYSLERLSK
jgi:exonuclease SbcD